MQTKVKKNRIEARIRFPNLNLTLESDKPEQSLRELNKILNAMKAIEFNKDYLDFDDDLFWRIGYLSEDLRSNQDAMKFLRQAADVEPVLKHKKTAIINKQVLDFNQKTYASHVDMTQAKNKISSLCKGFEKSTYSLVHVSGNLKKEESEAIVDMLKRYLPRANLKSVLTHKKQMDKTVVEAVFCGSFEEN